MQPLPHLSIDRGSIPLVHFLIGRLHYMWPHLLDRSFLTWIPWILRRVVLESYLWCSVFLTYSSKLLRICFVMPSYTTKSPTWFPFRTLFIASILILTTPAGRATHRHMYKSPCPGEIRYIRILVFVHNSLAVIAMIDVNIDFKIHETLIIGVTAPVQTLLKTFQLSKLIDRLLTRVLASCMTESTRYRWQSPPTKHLWLELVNGKDDPALRFGAREIILAWFALNPAITSSSKKMRSDHRCPARFGYHVNRWIPKHIAPGPNLADVF